MQIAASRAAAQRSGGFPNRTHMTDVVIHCGWESGTEVTLPSLSARLGLGMQGSAFGMKSFQIEAVEE